MPHSFCTFIGIVIVFHFLFPLQLFEYFKFVKVFAILFKANITPSIFYGTASFFQKKYHCPKGFIVDFLGVRVKKVPVAAGALPWSGHARRYVCGCLSKCGTWRNPLIPGHSACHVVKRNSKMRMVYKHIF